ncbi:hypothetical protein A8C56_00875 [Niabella ginsenosidivorans]|uniref:2'-5' RNA ligase n=1 Tax=Niabella ginsenosidivorans TaxID=1176587 RepID=A0A1A9HZ21_9BACT|nr:hypothetical protein [Niabella ginsenosidivorans]ANH79720.1 hypothetical protein A8C56_00875 [Niabella ginsenosidivorans]
MQSVIAYKRDDFNRYQLILDLPPAIKKRFANARAKLDALFRGITLPGGHPFIYLAAFSGYETKETSWLSELHKVALGMMPFKVHLKNFALGNGDELYIDIAEKIVIQKIIEKISRIQHHWSDARLNPLPRITLVKGLYHWQLEKCWPYFEKEVFRSSFIMNRMLLLKQMPGFRSWQIERSFLFENQFIQE